MIDVNLQLFGGRGSGSSMGGGSVKSLNGVSSQDAILDYWSKGWSASSNNKRALAQTLVEGREQYAQRTAVTAKKQDQSLVEIYKDSTNEWTRKNLYEKPKQRLEEDDYVNQQRKEYDSFVASASADVAKRMGYDTSAYMGIGSVSPSELRKAMGTANANRLMEQVQDSAQAAIDAHKRRRK